MTPDELQDVAGRWSAAMKRGDFEAAWRQTDRIEIERRELEAAGGHAPQPHCLVWDGTAFDGKDVLVRCSHGLGDTLQFVRYVPLVRRVARSVTLLVQPHLLSLFKGTNAFGEVLDGWTGAPVPAHDVEIEVMELAYAFRSTAETVPRDVPYLPVDTLRSCDRSFPEIDRNALDVGVLWCASEWDATRSLALRDLEPLSRVTGVRFHSLQQGPEAARWREAPFPLTPLHERTGEVAAAAAGMLKLDLIVTVDAMAAHLAGALGRPVWVLLKHDCDWRWMTHRVDSPWYPTMRLFRQGEAGDWRSVVDGVACALRQRASGH